MTTRIKIIWAWYDLWADASIDYDGEVLQINDHGNMTLCLSSKDKFTEVWSTV